jgi:hypothetical protein
MLLFIAGILAFLSLMAIYALKWLGLGLGLYIAYWGAALLLAAPWPYLLAAHQLIGLIVVWALSYVVVAVVLVLSAALTVGH